MIKRTLCFENPAYLSLKNEQLLIKWPDSEREDVSIPIEDIGVLLLENRQITITNAVIDRMLSNNCALITCDASHMPVGLMLPLCGNTTQTKRFRQQIESSLPLKKQLWQRTISAKISNQAAVLSECCHCEIGNMKVWSKNVRSGDADNLEARAAVYYWSNIFREIDNFSRDRDGGYPNNFLNYGYAILRAVMARALVSSGLMPTLGIFHRNKYNAYCLADDIMEPYRPYVDRLVLEIIRTESSQELTTSIKRRLLSIPTIEVCIDGKRSPLMIAVSSTTASLQRCYANNDSSELLYPIM